MTSSVSLVPLNILYESKQVPRLEFWTRAIRAAHLLDLSDNLEFANLIAQLRSNDNGSTPLPRKDLLTLESYIGFDGEATLVTKLVDEQESTTESAYTTPNIKLLSQAEQQFIALAQRLELLQTKFNVPDPMAVSHNLRNVVDNIDEDAHESELYQQTMTSINAYKTTYHDSLAADADAIPIENNLKILADDHDFQPLAKNQLRIANLDPAAQQRRLREWTAAIRAIKAIDLGLPKVLQDYLTHLIERLDPTGELTLAEAILLEDLLVILPLTLPSDSEEYNNQLDGIKKLLDLPDKLVTLQHEQIKSPEEMLAELGLADELVAPYSELYKADFEEFKSNYQAIITNPQPIDSHDNQIRFAQLKGIETGVLSNLIMPLQQKLGLLRELELPSPDELLNKLGVFGDGNTHFAPHVEYHARQYKVHYMRIMSRNYEGYLTLAEDIKAFKEFYKTHFLPFNLEPITQLSGEDRLARQKFWTQAIFFNRVLVRNTESGDSIKAVDFANITKLSSYIDQLLDETSINELITFEQAKYLEDLIKAAYFTVTAKDGVSEKSLDATRQKLETFVQRASRLAAMHQTKAIPPLNSLRIWLNQLKGLSEEQRTNIERKISELEALHQDIMALDKTVNQHTLDTKIDQLVLKYQLLQKSTFEKIDRKLKFLHEYEKILNPDELRIELAHYLARGDDLADNLAQEINDFEAKYHVILASDLEPNNTELRAEISKLHSAFYNILFKVARAYSRETGQAFSQNLALITEDQLDEAILAKLDANIKKGLEFCSGMMIPGTTLKGFGTVDNDGFIGRDQLIKDYRRMGRRHYFLFNEESDLPIGFVADGSVLLPEPGLVEEDDRVLDDCIQFTGNQKNLNALTNILLMQSDYFTHFETELAVYHMQSANGQNINIQASVNKRLYLQGEQIVFEIDTQPTMIKKIGANGGSSDDKWIGSTFAFRGKLVVNTTQDEHGNLNFTLAERKLDTLIFNKPSAKPENTIKLLSDVAKPGLLTQEYTAPLSRYMTQWCKLIKQVVTPHQYSDIVTYNEHLPPQSVIDITLSRMRRDMKEVVSAYKVTLFQLLGTEELKIKSSTEHKLLVNINQCIEQFQDSSKNYNYNKLIDQLAKLLSEYSKKQTKSKTSDKRNTNNPLNVFLDQIVRLIIDFRNYQLLQTTKIVLEDYYDPEKAQSLAQTAFKLIEIADKQNNKSAAVLLSVIGQSVLADITREPIHEGNFRSLLGHLTELNQYLASHESTDKVIINAIHFALRLQTKVNSFPEFKDILNTKQQITYNKNLAIQLLIDKVGLVNTIPTFEHYPDEAYDLLVEHKDKLLSGSPLLQGNDFLHTLQAFSYANANGLYRTLNSVFATEKGCALGRGILKDSFMVVELTGSNIVSILNALPNKTSVTVRPRGHHDVETAPWKKAVQRRTTELAHDLIQTGFWRNAFGKDYSHKFSATDLTELVIHHPKCAETVFKKRWFGTNYHKKLDGNHLLIMALRGDKSVRKQILARKDLRLKLICCSNINAFAELCNAHPKFVGKALSNTELPMTTRHLSSGVYRPVAPNKRLYKVSTLLEEWLDNPTADLASKVQTELTDSELKTAMVTLIQANKSIVDRLAQSTELFKEILRNISAEDVWQLLQPLWADYANYKDLWLSLAGDEQIISPLINYIATAKTNPFVALCQHYNVDQHKQTWQSLAENRDLLFVTLRQKSITTGLRKYFFPTYESSSLSSSALRISQERLEYWNEFCKFIGGIDEKTEAIFSLSFEDEYKSVSQQLSDAFENLSTSSDEEGDSLSSGRTSSYASDDEDEPSSKTSRKSAYLHADAKIFANAVSKRRLGVCSQSSADLQSGSVTDPHPTKTPLKT